MNYIKSLEEQNRVLTAKVNLAQEMLINFQVFLNSAKFVGTENGERKDWVATGDVIGWIQEVRREILL